MALPDLTGQNIENTYNRVVQTDGTLFYDGTGSLLDLGGNIDTGSLLTTASFNSYTGSTTSQFAGTASFASTASFITGSTNAFIQGGNSFGTTALFGTNDNQSLALETSGSTRMFISSNGTVGIGTITPTYGLEIQGNSNTLTGIRILNTTNSNTLNLLAQNTDSTISSNNRVFIQSSTTLAASAAGNIGIGVSNSTAGAKLHTIGNVLFGGIASTAVGASLHVRGSGATSATTTFLVQNSTPTNILTVLDNGTVGIGRTPTQTLDIAGTTRMSGSFNTAASGSILTVQGSGSAQPIFTVLGSQGELFSIVDSLSGSLFSVNDISGLPILEVFSDGTTLIGDYLDPMLITTKKSLLTNSGSFTVYSLPTASYDTAFFDYSVRSGSNARAGQIMAIQSGSSVNYTEVTSSAFGTTTDLALGVFISGSNMVLTGSAATTAWTIKAIIRSL
jgi:hypothetical protein